MLLPELASRYPVILCIGLLASCAGCAKGETASSPGDASAGDSGGSSGGGGSPAGGGGQDSGYVLSDGPSESQAGSDLDAPSSEASDADDDASDADRDGSPGKNDHSGAVPCTTTCAESLICERTTLTSAAGVCVTRCLDDSSCASGQGCASVGEIVPPSCFQKCVAGACAAPMTCIPVSTGDSVCIPSAWLPHNLGLGDGCLLDSECASGTCTNKPNGWCSRPCATFDLCAGINPDGTNNDHEYNWCVSTAAGYSCTAGCGTHSADCASYPGTTCKYVVDIDGDSSARACLP